MIVSGFLSALGLLNPFITYAIICAGDLTGDVMYYSLGRWWFKSAHTKILNFFNVRQKSQQKIQDTLEKNRGKVLFFGKLSHALGLPILIIAGATKIPIAEFIWFNFLATLPKSFILWGVGYYFGNTVGTLSKSLFDYTVFGLFFFTIILVVIYYVITYISGKFFKNL